ncbi:MAG: SpoIIE family protein phosphatase [Candidatus Zixiibacteriota bacterium]|nr:MAG: SpoIIE family protein phosphatase [candidate division Zixibacteria bacterium]
MNVGQLIDLVYLASGLTLFMLAGVIFRENPRGRLNIIASMMMLFAGIGPLAASAYGSFLEGIPDIPSWLLNSFYVWELFFPSLLYFSAIFPEPQPFFFRHKKLFQIAFLPTVFHLLMVVLLAEPERVLGFLNFESSIPIIGAILSLVFEILRMITAFIGFLLLFHSRFFSIINLAYVIFALIILYYGFKRIENPRLKQQVRVVIYGISIGVGLYTLAIIIPTIVDINLANPVRVAMVMLGLVVGPGSISWAIVKYQFLDIGLIARKSLVYSISTAIFVGGYLLIVMQAGSLIQSLIGRESQMMNVLVIIVMLLFFQPIYTQVDDFVKRIFIRFRGDYSRLLESFSREILTVFQEEKLASTVKETLRREMFIENVEVCFREGERSYKLVSSDLVGPPVEMEEQAYNYLISKQSPLFADELSSKFDEKCFGDALKYHDTEVIVPLIRKDKLAGLLLLSSKVAGFRYGSEDLAFLKILANQIIVALESCDLYRESLEKQRMEEELAVAKQIQRGLLPRELPMMGNFDFAAFIEPSRQVGGDYYDFIPIGNTRTGIVIADASGKGVPAALFAARMQVMIQSEVKFGKRLREMMASINNFLSVSTSGDSFATCFYGEIDDIERRLYYCNAGHNYPILVRKNGSIENLKKGGLILGAFPEEKYETGEVLFKPGDVLILYTDGLSEAMNDRNIEYGEQRLMENIRKFRTHPAEVICSMIIKSVKQFAAGADDLDDMTLVIVRAKET